jgi:PDZ domain-containing protein
MVIHGRLSGSRARNPQRVVDTIEPMLSPASAGGGPTPPDEGAVDEPRPERRRLWFVLGTIVALLTIGTIAAAFVQVPYFLLAPGSVRSTEGLISVEGAPTYQTEGEIDFTTVSVKRSTALQALVGWLDPTVDVIEEDKILGGQTQDENRERNLQEMADSKEIATAVALEALGYEVGEQGSGALIVNVATDVPAAEVLQRGDVIVAADGRPVQLSQDLVDVISTKRPGDTVVLGVQRSADLTEDVTAQLVARPDDPNRAMLGVSLETFRLQYEFPFTVTIDSGSVGGPSAGLAFTLGVIDVLTPDSLTGGERVATTGTIDSSGAVGPVGGVQQKTVAVRRAGATLFLVPPSEYEEALKYAGDMRVERVETLDDALRALASIGGGTDAVALAASPGG